MAFGSLPELFRLANVNNITGSDGDPHNWGGSVRGSMWHEGLGTAQ